MRHTLLIAVLLLAACGEDEPYECTLDFDAQHSFIDTNTPGVTVTENELRDQNEYWLTQKVRLWNGTHVAMGLGGCAHYGFALTFRNIPGVAADKHPTTAQIKAALASLPIKEDRAAELRNVFSFIKTPAKDGEFDCGDATCFVHTKPGEFDFSYDFAL